MYKLDFWSKIAITVASLSMVAPLVYTIWQGQLMDLLWAIGVIFGGLAVLFVWLWSLIMSTLILKDYVRSLPANHWFARVVTFLLGPV